MKRAILLLLLMTTTGINAQWAGTYYGTANGDNVVMTLEQAGNTVQGTMKDSYQTFAILGTVNGSQFAGTASEHALQVEFELRIVKTGNTLDCKLMIESYGTVSESLFSVSKQDGNAAQQAPSTSTSKIPFPSDATFPAALAGTWTQNESYNSGSGSNFMGANFSQSMTFHSDGTLSEGGSSASMSGSNYSNQSSGTGSGKLEGLGWYAKQNNFFLLVFNNGSWTTVPVGTWYAENNHLLITTQQGEKLLLSR